MEQTVYVQIAVTPAFTRLHNHGFLPLQPGLYKYRSIDSSISIPPELSNNHLSVDDFHLFVNQASSSWPKTMFLLLINNHRFVLSNV